MFPTIHGFDTLAAATDAGRPTPTRQTPTDADYLHWGCALRDKALCLKPSEWRRLLSQAAATPRDAGLDIAAEVVRMIDAWVASDMPAVYARMQREDTSPVDTWTAMAEEQRDAEWRARHGQQPN